MSVVAGTDAGLQGSPAVYLVRSWLSLLTTSTSIDWGSKGKQQQQKQHESYDYYYPGPQNEQERWERDSHQILVLGTGFSRSSTNSLFKALEILGYKTQHMIHLMVDPRKSHAWTRFLLDPDNDDDNVEPLLNYLWRENITALVDAPGNVPRISQKLMTMYPNAKIVHGIHPKGSCQAWVKSFRVLLWTCDNMVHPIFQYPWIFLSSVRSWVRMIHAMDFYFLLNNHKQVPDEQFCTMYLDRINDMKILKQVQPNRSILIQNAQYGWEYLTPFLNISQPPAIEYPKGNSSQSMILLVWTLRSISLVFFLVPILLILFMLRMMIRQNGKPKLRKKRRGGEHED